MWRLWEMTVFRGMNFTFCLKRKHALTKKSNRKIYLLSVMGAEQNLTPSFFFSLSSVFVKIIFFPFSFTFTLSLSSTLLLFMSLSLWHVSLSVCTCSSAWMMFFFDFLSQPQHPISPHLTSFMS